jgi:hypothetical protein
VLTRAHQWTTTPHLIYLGFICVLSSHLPLGLPSCRFPSGFSKIIVRDMFLGDSRIRKDTYWGPNFGVNVNLKHTS